MAFRAPSSVKYCNTFHKAICHIDLRKLFITEHSSNYLLSCPHLNKATLAPCSNQPQKKRGEALLALLCSMHPYLYY